MISRGNKKRSSGGGGLAVGIGIGVALGVAVDNMGAGVAIGIAIGLALGAAQRGKKPSADQPLEESFEPILMRPVCDHLVRG